MLTKDWCEKPLPEPPRVYSSYLEDVFSTRPQVYPVMFPWVPVLALTIKAQFWILLSGEDRASEVVGGAHWGLIRPHFLQLPGGASAHFLAKYLCVIWCMLPLVLPICWSCLGLLPDVVNRHCISPRALCISSRNCIPDLKPQKYQ